MQFFASGPQGAFFTNTADQAESLIKAAGFDRDDWTITDLGAPTAPDWSEAPEWATCRTTDKYGTRTWWANTPKPGTTFWYDRQHGLRKHVSAGADNWRDTLEMRP